MIEVTITNQELLKLPGAWAADHYVAEKLRAAGVPIQGSISRFSIDDGFLVISEIEDAAIYVYVPTEEST